MPQKKLSQNDKASELKFEEALKRIEEINSILSRGECGLDEAVALFEEGTKLADICGDKLKKAEQKIISVTAENKNEL